MAVILTPRQLYEAQGCKCFICGARMSVWPDEHASNCTTGWTRDHFIPKSKLKGKRPMYNIVLTHQECNRIKDNTLPNSEEIRKFRELHMQILVKLN